LGEWRKGCARIGEERNGGEGREIEKKRRGETGEEGLRGK